MATTGDKPKLSLLATFDDQARLLQSFIDSMDDNFYGPIGMFQDYEKNRKRWLLSNREISERDQQIAELNKENQELKIRLEIVRVAYTREMKQKDQLQKDYNELRKKLLMVQDLLNEERGGSSTRSNSVLSVLSELNKLPTINKNVKSKSNDPNESDDGLLFDKSDDTLEDMDTDDHRTENKVRRIEPIYAQVDFGKKGSMAPPPPPPPPAPTMYSQIKSTANLHQKHHHSTIAEEVEEDNESVLNVGFISTEKAPVQPDYASDKGFSSTPYSSIKSIDDLKSQCKQIALSKSPSTVSVSRRKSGKLMTKFNLMRNASKLEPERLDSRAHSFVPKKAFKPMNCSACNKSIGFCSSCLACGECRSVVHPRCQEALPKPCLPYVASNAGLKKMLSSGASGLFSGTHMVMITDFTTPDARPCIPALMIYCCNELDRRIELALKDPKVLINGPDASPVVGMYRICGSEREVRELRGRILEAKCGVPNLSTVTDPNVICGVVKSFLRDLDDPLVTRILWNDFVRAAEHVEEFAGKDNCLSDSDYDSRAEENLDSSNDEWYEALQVLKSVIIQLPNANRDTLAFLFIHLRHVIDCQAVTRMDARGLSKIFAPTIVGSSVQTSGHSSSLEWQQVAFDEQRSNERKHQTSHRNASPLPSLSSLLE